MSEHTPTPWRMDPTLHDIYADNVPKGPMKVADIRGWGYLTGKGHGALGLSYDEGVAVQAANAAFIVKAVNNHDALVKALVGAQRIIERDFPNGQLAIDIRGILASVGKAPSTGASSHPADSAGGRTGGGE